MKTSQFSPKRSAFALVVVLAILALLLGLAVTFLYRAREERSSTASFAAFSATQRLADLATSLVKGQIHDATTQGNAVAWTSQPGMIRTFGSGAPGSFTSGSNLLRVFKLYSAQELIATSGSTSADTPPSTWQSSGALWTDINAPVLVQNPDGKTPAKNPRFPILDPGALDQVEGFSVTSSASPAGTVLTGSSDVLRLPMPVRWIYVLQDGSMITPPETSGTTATVAGATTTNPIVGRVAFWTDDETCKINVNTASEGSCWDTPRADTTDDRNMANYQPAQNEFQRYPGHPAMTSLAPVFFATSSTSTPTLTGTQYDAIYSIVPRVVGGGSVEGTQMATGALTPDTDRLYASVDEMVFAANRSDQLTSIFGTSLRTKLEAAKFFLTTSSQAPEITLFNTPRVAMWPIFQNLASNPTRVTAFDRLMAFCSTIKSQPYYFQRSNAFSPTADWANIQRNRQLLRYLRALSDNAVPGYGASLASKTTTQDRDQLLVEMMDYIRSTNLYDDNLSPNTYSSTTLAQSAVQFTVGRANNATQVYDGHGVVAPLRVPAGLPDSSGTSSYPSEPDKSSYMGFGRFHTISDAGLLFICTGDGSQGVWSGTVSNPMTASDYKRLSNSTSNNLTLSGTLGINERRIQAMLFFDFFDVMQGWTQYAMTGSFDVELQGGDFAINGTSLGLPSSASANLDQTGGNMYSPWGGSIGVRKPLFNHYAPTDTGATASNTYPFISNYITVSGSGSNPTMHFQGPSKVLVKIYNRPTTSSTPRELVQTIELAFPAADFSIPELKTCSTTTTAPQNYWSFNRNGAVSGTVGLITTTGAVSGATGGRLSVISGGPVPSSNANDNSGCLIWPEDTLRTLVPYHGDIRLIAGSHYVPHDVFQPFSGYYNTTRQSPNYYGTFSRNYTSPYPQIKNQLLGSGASTYDAEMGFYLPPSTSVLVTGANYPIYRLPKFPVFSMPSGADQSAQPFNQFGDFDNGVSTTQDGAYINKPDEGNNYRGSSSIPYYTQNWNQAAGGPTFFSPNRQIPGPGMFGSLPTCLFSGNQGFVDTSTNTNNPWRTLLVRPQTGHPGAANPPDHLWLDLFWMPVVEPYAISSPFSTAGKINMNYGIEPFSYIRRATGLVGLLRSERIYAVPTSKANDYKSGGENTFRNTIDSNETLKQFDTRFASGSVFLSPSQICDIHLVPSGQTLNSDGSNADSVMNTFWQTNALTGDNSRERPYTNIEGRLTTKSNTYTVHYRVQTLKKTPTGNPALWNESRDSVTGELRGSETIERYINPNDATIPDYAAQYSANASASPQDLGQYYKWRTVNSRKFAP